MTKDQKAKYVYTTKDLWRVLEKLEGMKIKLDCGHHLTIRPGHGFTNDFMVHQGTNLKLKDRWGEIREALVKKIDKNFSVYENNTFKMRRFEEYLVRNNIAWPRLPTGRLDMQDATFREMSRINPQLDPLRELRHTLGQMQLTDLAVGADGRNRCLLSAFRSRTGRNQPSNAKFL